MRVTIETVIDEEMAREFLTLYRDAFDPLDGLAASRQALTDEEFLEEMALETVLKFVGRDRRGVPRAMAIIATDLDTVPWISPRFWRDRYPEHAARGAIYYFGALLVSPLVRGGPWAYRMLRETVKFTARNHAVAAFDCCQHNIDEVDLPRMIADVAHSLALVDTEKVDTQTYFAYVTHGLLESEETSGLRSEGEAQIDLSDPQPVRNTTPAGLRP